MKMIEDMLKQNPNDPFLMYAAALEYKKRSELNRTEDLFRSLIEKHPDYLATYYQLGKLLEAKGNTEEAVSIYKQGKAVAKTQDDLKTLSELSEALLILDEDEGELRDFCRKSF